MFYLCFNYHITLINEDGGALKYHGDVKKPSHHSTPLRDEGPISSYIVGLTSTNRYFLRKRDIERSETGAKPIAGQVRPWMKSKRARSASFKSEM